MSDTRISEDEMQQRIVRFAELKQRDIPLMFIDSVLPGHQRMNYAVIGDTASENPEFQSAVGAPHKFQIGMVNAPPGKGPAYYTHDYVERFIVLTGHEFRTGPNGKMIKSLDYEQRRQRVESSLLKDIR